MKLTNKKIVWRGALALAVIATVFFTATTMADDELSPEIKEMFKEFKKKFNRNYGSEDEERFFELIFGYHVLTFQEYAAKNPHATYGATIFSDMVPYEFTLGYTIEPYGSAKEARPWPRLPSKVSGGAGYVKPSKWDWREHGAVTPVKKQIGCASGWAFSIIASLESAQKVATGNLVELSEQHLISCFPSTDICEGNTLHDPMYWLTGAVQVAYTAQSWPLESKHSEVRDCNTTGRTVGATNVHTMYFVDPDEDKMVEALVTRGALSAIVSIDTWDGYTGGIIEHCESATPKQAVAIVGYNDESNPPYWIVKNSWGVQWGEEGYIRIAKGKNACGIKNDVKILGNFVE